MALSVKRELRGRVVLLTGGLGFLGSVVLEQLLRQTEVSRVYLLVRGKKHVPASKRVEQVLCGALFSALHKEAEAGGRNAFSRVRAVEGDLGFPGLGLSAEDAATLANEVDVVIHCAANLDLDAPIQKTIRSNYVGTKELLALASRMQRLRSFVFTSTYFVNNHLPRNSAAPERVHDSLPLELGGRRLGHAEFVEALLAMDAAEADAQAAALMSRLGFVSTYAFGKLLTELLVDGAGGALPRGAARAIVRPSLISGVAGAPYPGYITGFAGSPGYLMGYAAGFFPTLGSVAFASDYILDLIPADTAASLVIAAAAEGAAAGRPQQQQQQRAGGGTAVYHAASAQSYPLPVWYAYDEMASFWSANPPPFRLPFTRYVRFCGKHEATELSLAVGRWITEAKIWAVGKLLQWMGRARQARALANGFKAFCVQNSPCYSRSIVSSVGNARALQARIEPSERELWRCVWDESAMGWDFYGQTFFAGVRRLLFRDCRELAPVRPHAFALRPDASPAARELVAAALAGEGEGGGGAEGAGGAPAPPKPAQGPAKGVASFTIMASSVAVEC